MLLRLRPVIGTITPGNVVIVSSGNVVTVTSGNVGIVTSSNVVIVRSGNVVTVTSFNIATATYGYGLTITRVMKIFMLNVIWLFIGTNRYQANKLFKFYSSLHPAH